MSEYQYYKFERVDGPLPPHTRQALRAISSRAEISTTTFQVYYTYSDLKADPAELMLNYFDIGFYYADWGSIDAYLKLPAGTIPDALLGVSLYGLQVEESDEWQLLTFSIEEYGEYFDDEQADDFFQHLAAMRTALIQGDWRLVYLMWLKECEFNEDIDRVPLIHFDFEHLSEEVQAFATLYDIPLAWVNALALVLKAHPSHPARQAELQFDGWFHQLTDPAYHYWLTPNLITPYIEQAQRQLQQAQAEARAKKMALEKAEKEKALTAIYQQREHAWQQAQEQTDRSCASGYDAASRYVHQLWEAYQFKGGSPAFAQRFERFVVVNNSRKARLTRLKDLL